MQQKRSRATQRSARGTQKTRRRGSRDAAWGGGRAGGGTEMAGSGGRTRACLPACPVRRLVCRRPEWSSPRTPRRRLGQAPGPRHCAQSPSRAWRLGHDAGSRPLPGHSAPSPSRTLPVTHASALPDLSSLPSGTAIPRPTPSRDAAPCHGLFGKLHLLKCPRAPAPPQPMLRMRLAPADQDVGRVLLVLVTSSVSAPWECPSSRQSVRFALFLPTPRKVPPCPPARPSPLKSRRCRPFGFVSVLNCSDAKTETGAANVPQTATSLLFPSLPLDLN